MRSRTAFLAAGASLACGLSIGSLDAGQSAGVPAGGAQPAPRQVPSQPAARRVMWGWATRDGSVALLEDVRNAVPMFVGQAPGTQRIDVGEHRGKIVMVVGLLNTAASLGSDKTGAAIESARLLSVVEPAAGLQAWYTLRNVDLAAVIP